MACLDGEVLLVCVCAGCCPEPVGKDKGTRAMQHRPAESARSCTTKMPQSRARLDWSSPAALSLQTRQNSNALTVSHRPHRKKQAVHDGVFVCSCRWQQCRVTVVATAFCRRFVGSSKINTYH